jgi:hypothetical protein
MVKNKQKTIKVSHGEKMIEIQIRFWTNNIAKGSNKILQKHCWSKGVVKIQSNLAHGIKATNPIPFHSLMDLTSIIEKVIIKHNIILHNGSHMRKYFV